MSGDNGKPDPTRVYKIWDPNSKKWREARDFRHATYDDQQGYDTSQFVEFTVVGRNHDWKLFMTLADMQMYNEDVPIAGARKE